MHVFVIMGAEVRPSGELTGALRRRLEGALSLARNLDATFVVTGQGSGGRTEAVAMAAVLQANGVPRERIIQDPASHDTLSSVIQCANIIKRQTGVESVIVCSDRYHIPRCRWLFHLLHVPTLRGDMPSGLRANGVFRWTYYYLREAPAIVLDTILLLLRRLRQG